jgi:hypothetical protein
MNGSSKAGALHVVEQDVQVVGIDQRVLRVTRRRSTTGCDDELVDRRAAGHEHRRDRVDRRPARPARCHVAAIVPG